MEIESLCIVLKLHCNQITEKFSKKSKISETKLRMHSIANKLENLMEEMQKYWKLGLLGIFVLA